MPSHLKSLSVILFSVIFLSVLLYVELTTKENIVVYNCSIAEISPDIPVAVKQKCREKMKHDNR